ncbi:curli assembly protein CsgF [Shewanella indica]|uniref:Curli production assembly/transport component CsgF n=1 Tax=Shewanella chilikensis TaxID=558541 RepID=A0A6G7LW16_9GAMM|nr:MULTISPECIES: curli assembly protein CsgF [Shewanella]MBZ4679959.1 putative curli production assembly/transport component CsgF [Shewanella sp.]OHY56739.1 curli production assembly protein CsgF [Shewanella algae]QIJ05951.1 curli production assembly protein CsgF [Shewanella chilikensis]GHB18157.1 curli production assembly protein CsgF [Shewanella indica]HCD15801.1 curli production assembly protein CsgF [Shewanella sp.]
MTLRMLIAAGALLAFSGQTTELVYTPINPSFGGNPLNGSFLLSKAQAQNDNQVAGNEKDFVTRFKESLERNIINSITRGVADGDITDGVYDTGDYRVEVASTGSGVMLTITNLLSGEVTVIEMPIYGGNP